MWSVPECTSSVAAGAPPSGQDSTYEGHGATAGCSSKLQSLDDRKSSDSSMTGTNTANATTRQTSPQPQLKSSARHQPNDALIILKRSQAREDWDRCRYDMDPKAGWVKDGESLLMWIPSRYRQSLLDHRLVMAIEYDSQRFPPVVDTTKLFACADGEWAHMYKSV